MKKFATYSLTCLGHLDKYLGTYLAFDMGDAARQVLSDHPDLTIDDIRLTRIYVY